MTVKTTKETAQEMTFNSVKDYITFSIEFYAIELGKEIVKNPNSYAVEHCEEMYRAYKQLGEYMSHFKFN